MYLPIYSPTRILVRLKMNGIQVYKKEFYPEQLDEVNSLDTMKKFILSNTKCKKDFDSYFTENLCEVLTNSDGY